MSIIPCIVPLLNAKVIPPEEQNSQCFRAFQASHLSKNHTNNSFAKAYYEFKKTYVPPKVVACAPPHVRTGDLTNLSWEEYIQDGFDEVEREMLGYN